MSSVLHGADLGGDLLEVGGGGVPHHDLVHRHLNRYKLSNNWYTSTLYAVKLGDKVIYGLPLR